MNETIYKGAGSTKNGNESATLQSSGDFKELAQVLFDGEDMKLECIKVKITSAINKHIAAHVMAIVPEQTYDDYAKKASSATKLTVKHTIDGAETLLYEGLITRIVQMAEGAGKENSVYHIEINALSHTCLLDVKKICRSFQDKTMQYDALISEVLQDYSGADFINTAAKGTQQEVFVLQYLDTDWEFLTREISKFEQGLFADATLPSPKFYFGTPEGIPRGKLEQYEYTISKNVGMFSGYDKNEYAHGSSEFDFMGYEILDEHATDTFCLGDEVNYQGSTLYIYKIISEIIDHKLYNTYKLTTKNGLKMPRLANGDIQGLSIPGKVIDVEKNLLKLHLEIDEDQPVGTAYWFDYAAFYATWYCMPELNDIVNLHIPTCDERDAIGLNSFKQNPAGGYTRNNQPQTPPNASAAGKPGPIDFEKSASDPDVKILTTKSGRMVQLGPDNITILYDENTYIVLHDSDGIVMETNLDISLHADGKIIAYAQDNIEFEAEKMITLRNKASEITIEPSKITVKSSDTRMN